MLQISKRDQERLEALSIATGFPAEQFIREAVEDWFVASSPTYIAHAAKRRQPTEQAQPTNLVVMSM